jgi:hypothetical protein
MSPKNSLLNVGLTAVGWFGFVASSAADPGSSPPPGQPQPAAVAPSPSPTVLSLYDGRVLQGKIQVDDSGYSLLQNGGMLRFRKEQVEGAFGSLHEVYRFKAERVPGRDPDERLKLAHWCLAHRLNAEAKAQLLAVLELSPGNVQIKNMISNIDNALARQAPRDEGIQQARAERPIDGRPRELDAEIFPPGRKAPAALGLPTIFDLPTSLAVRRADEFNRGVHQVLQQYCARCHNENHQGDFQLIQVKNRHDWTQNVARANLEATLRVIDPDSPSRSELLSRALVPHGPARRPIFQGANDPNYRRIAAWVNSLRPKPAAVEAATSRFGTEEPPPSSAEGFATDRSLPSTSPLPPESPADGRPRPPATPNPRIPLPPGQFVAGSGSGSQPFAPPDAEFPVPYMVGGPRPKLEATPAVTQPQGQPASATSPSAPAPAPATVGGALPPLPAGTPAVPAPAAANVPAQTNNAAPKPARKAVKVDPALLERALMNKYVPN